MTTTTNNKTNETLTLDNFLARHQISKGCSFTHTSLGKPGGSFYITEDRTFYDLYCEALKKGQDLYLTEKNRHITPIKIDLDFRFALPAEETDGNGEAKKKQHHGKFVKSKDVEEIMYVFIDLLNTFFDVSQEEDHKFTAYVLEKKNSKVTGNEIKDGIHIMIPHIVTRPSVLYVIREEAIRRLTPLFQRLKCLNTPESIVDEAVIERNNWIMYGSKKNGGEPYLVTRVFEVVRDKESIKLNSKKVPKDEDPCPYVRLFSIRNKYDETKVRADKRDVIRACESQQAERRMKMEVSRHIIIDRMNTTPNESSASDLHQVNKLVTLLNPQRAESYESWIRLGWCLRNIDYRLLDVWDNFSKHSSKYTPGECANVWTRMRKCTMGLGTLHFWAKEDNLDAYKTLMHNELRDLMKSSISGTHTDVAHVIASIYRGKFVCTSMKQRDWFEFRDHRWVYVDNGVTLRQKISSEVFNEYITCSTEWGKRSINTSDDDTQKRNIEIAQKLCAIALKLKTVSFKDSVMKECAELLYEPKFESKLDEQDNLIGFNNGIFDLDTGEFRDGRPEDYVSLTTGMDYIDYDANDPNIQGIQAYLSQVLTKPDVREYVVKLFASFLHGSLRNQKFYIWTGSGSNSKSKLLELFMSSFGEYCCVFPISMLTSKRVASNAANSELALAKGKRFALMSEPENDERINVGLMKELSGGDRIIARRMYREPVEFNPKFKMVLACNKLPIVPSDDGGTWRRIRVVEFTSKFVENPKGENEFPIDVDFGQNFVKWRPYFISMLIEYYKIYKIEGLKEPDDVLRVTREYKRQNDHMADFICNSVEKKEGAFLPLNDVFSDFKAWIRDNNITLTKTPTKPELCEYLKKNMAECVTKNNVPGFVNFRLKSTAYVEDNNDDDD